MDLTYSNAKFAMAIRDVWTPHDGGSVYFNSFICGHVYPIIDMSYDNNRAVETEKARYYLPIGRHDRGTNEFCKDFILVESEDTEVEPYTSLKKIRATISEISDRHHEELSPIRKRHNEEIGPYRKELYRLEDIIGIPR